MDEYDGASSHDREFQRVGDTMLVSYSIGSDFEPEFTETYDIGSGGMAMLTNAELRKDAELHVRIELNGDTRPTIELRAAVRWSQFDPLLHRYRTGVAFVDVDDETRAHLQRYIDALHLLRDMGVI